MRRLVVLLTCMAVIAAACESGESEEPTGSETLDETAETTEEPPTATEDEPVTAEEPGDTITWTWNVSETGDPDAAFGQTARYFAEQIEERSDGRLVIEQHFGGALGYGAGEMLEVVGEGFVDGGDLSMPHVSGTEPLTNFGALPMLHTGYEEHWDFIDNLFIPETEERFREQWNVIPIGSYTFGQMYLLWTEALNEVEQLEGERFRVFNEVHGEFFELAGVNPIYLPVEELAAAMERGMMDGMPNSNPLIIQLEAWRHLSHRNVLGAVTGSSLYAVNRDSFEALPEDLQSLVLEVGQEATEHGRELLIQEDEEAEERISEEGMITHQVPEETLNELRELGEQAWYNWAEGLGEDAVELLDRTLQR